MSDQVDLIYQIIDAMHERDNSRAMALVCELNAVAEQRGLGDNYWLRFCKSMIDAHAAVG